jgi:hypothetical protein
LHKESLKELPPKLEFSPSKRLSNAATVGSKMIGEHYQKAIQEDPGIISEGTTSDIQSPEEEDMADLDATLSDVFQDHNKQQIIDLDCPDEEYSFAKATVNQAAKEDHVDPPS